MQILAAPSAGILSSFTDEFTDTNPWWVNTSGTWSRSSGDATTATAASSYPLSSFDAGKNRGIFRTEGAVANTFGWGVAFWVVDSNNWWAVVTDRTSYSCVVGSTTGCCACGNEGQSLNNPPSCDCVYPSCANSPNNPACGQTQSAGTCTYDVIGTCYSYNIKVLRRVSGTVTQMGSAVVSSGNIGASLTIGYVQVVTDTAGQITATAQMSTGGTIAQIQQTPTATRANRHGMIIAPSSAGQSSGLERYVYTSVL